MDFQTAAKVGFGGGFALGTALMARGAMQDVKAGHDLSGEGSHFVKSIEQTLKGSLVAGTAAVALTIANKGEIGPITELLGMTFLGSFMSLPVSGSIAQAVGGAMVNRQAG